jgi:sec-independent protein translocase protein TatA
MELFGSGGIVILALIAVMFGAKKLPEMARSIGRAQGEFKKGLQEGHSADPLPDEPPNPTDPPSPAP